MKAFQFKSKATVLRGVKEEKSPKRTNWDRVIYLILFLLIFVSLLFYTLQKNVFINVDGQIFTERFTVNFPEDVIVERYFYNEGDTIEKGDTLFYYRWNLNGNYDDGNGGGVAVAVSSSNGNNNYNWYLKERIVTQKDISIKLIGIKEIDDNTKRILADLERLRKEVYLDVYPKLELEAARLKLKSLEVDRSRLVEEIRYLRRYLAQLNGYIYRANQAGVAAVSGSGSGGNSIRWAYYQSPVDGIISKISVPALETSYKKDVVMYLSNTDKMFIYAFVEQKDIGYFEEGETLQLDFPDGTVSEGIIQAYNLNTEVLPLEFKKAKDRDRRSVVAKIVPTSDDEQVKWKKYYQYEVRISKTKFQ
ncbi:MAG: HlyD family secretion protein [Bacteroidales bacterium]|nr:HlyD family secretion protein [Bacteroidales bacterium]